MTIVVTGQYSAGYYYLPKAPVAEHIARQTTTNVMTTTKRCARLNRLLSISSEIDNGIKLHPDCNQTVTLKCNGTPR